ncbi:MAG: hypothetical protein IPP64_06700 [Bacteroidetes bacterium]|nr:hypothetical protein [Bacteroidota bacterium]
MKNNLILTDIEKYVIFTDVNNKESIYAVTKEEQLKKEDAVEKYGSVDKVPDELTIKASRLRLVDNTDLYYNKYDIIDNELIDFPINRYYWIFIQMIKTK